MNLLAAGLHVRAWVDAHDPKLGTDSLKPTESWHLAALVVELRISIFSF